MGLVLAVPSACAVADRQAEATWKPFVQAQICTAWQGNKDCSVLAPQLWRQSNTSQQPQVSTKTDVKNRFRSHWWKGLEKIKRGKEQRSRSHQHPSPVPAALPGHHHPSGCSTQCPSPSSRTRTKLDFSVLNFPKQKSMDLVKRKNAVCISANLYVMQFVWSMKNC